MHSVETTCISGQYDMEKIFKRESSSLSRIANWMTNFIVTTKGNLLTSLKHSWVDLDSFAKVRFYSKNKYELENLQQEL